MPERGGEAEERAGQGLQALGRPSLGFLAQSLREEPVHILNVAIRYADHHEDEQLVPIFRTFVQSKVRGAFAGSGSLEE